MMATDAAATSPLSIQAPAKVNLFLELLAKRDDGYHELVTVMQAVDLCDTVELHRTESGIEFQTDSSAVPGGTDNLAWRAAALWFERSRVQGGVRISLTKRIPVGAGLGGGSSDAAAVLNGLTSLYGADVESGQLESWAAELGSDVPFFIRGGTGRCTGRGEIVTSLKLSQRPIFYCLALPNLGVSTVAVYGNVSVDSQSDPRKADHEVVHALEQGAVPELGRVLFNRLEDTAYELYSALQPIADAMKSIPSCGVLMSGSGSCIYSVHESKADAERMEAELSERPVRVKTVVAQTHAS